MTCLRSVWLTSNRWRDGRQLSAKVEATLARAQPWILSGQSSKTEIQIADATENSQAPKQISTTAARWIFRRYFGESPAAPETISPRIRFRSPIEDFTLWQTGKRHRFDGGVSSAAGTTMTQLTGQKLNPEAGDFASWLRPKAAGRSNSGVYSSNLFEEITPRPLRAGRGSPNLTQPSLDQSLPCAWQCFILFTIDSKPGLGKT